MIKKQFLKSKPVCKVTFSLPGEQVNNAEQVQLVGEFSNWLEQPIEMKKQKDGSFKAVVELETGKDYQFRYFVNGNSWTNDGAADRYIPTGISFEENSVVSLSEN
jgi:1,4-alpha-glucan branching enzyme